MAETQIAPAFPDGVCLSFSRDASAFLQVFFAGFRLGNSVICLWPTVPCLGSHALLLGIDIREAGKDRKGISIEVAAKVVTASCGDDVGGLFIRFKHAKITEGEPARDGQVILHYDEYGKIHRRACGFMKRASGKAGFSWAWFVLGLVAS